MNGSNGEVLSKGQRLALWLPFIGGAVFGVTPLFPRFFANLFGFSGNDGFIYQLAGAATFGYAVALWYAICGKEKWEEVRYVVLATLVFNIVSIFVCLSAIFAGGAQWVVYAILLTSIAIVAVTGQLLASHNRPKKAAKNVSGGTSAFLTLATVAAFVFGILPLFSPFTSKLFGYMGTDKFIFGQAGAATLGYAVMGYFGFSSKNYKQIRLPVLMGAVDNALSFIASALLLLSGQRNLLLILVAPASLLFAIGLFYIFNRASKTSAQ